MSHGDIVIGSLITFEWIFADEKGQVAAFGGEIRLVGLLVYLNMATITTGVGDRVTNLARHCPVHFVHDQIFAFCRLDLMAIFTSRHLPTGIPMIRRPVHSNSGIIAVELSSPMAIGTFHSPFTEVNISFEIFMLSKVFVTNPAAMASSTVACHRRCCLEKVSFNKTSTNRSWLADMAIATIGVATGTVITEHLFKFFVVVRRTAFVDYCPITFLR